VQIAPAHEAQFSVSHFAQAVVRKIVLRSSSAFDNAPPPEFVECMGNAGFVPIGGVRQQFEGKWPSYNTRKAGQFVRSRR
jgi:hypothetical protein